MKQFNTMLKRRIFLVLIISLLFPICYILFIKMYYDHTTSRNENITTLSNVKSDLKEKRIDHTKREFYTHRLKIVQALKRTISKLEKNLARKDLPVSFKNLPSSMLKKSREDCYLHLQKYNDNARKLELTKFQEWRLPHQLDSVLCDALE